MSNSSGVFELSVTVKVKPLEGVASADASVPEETRGFRSVLPRSCDQQQAFDMVAPSLCESFLQGCNCTVFLYGQTGSGKTYTLFGPPSCFSQHVVNRAAANGLTLAGGVPPEWGIFPRAVMHFLEASGSPLMATVSEVYMNNCYDLLNNRNAVQVAGSGKTGLNTARSQDPGARGADGKWVSPGMPANRTRSSSKEEKNDSSGFEVSGQTQMPLRNMHDILSLMSIVDNSRCAKSHALNDRSSRSHCIVTITLARTGSRFLFVDLAGSERVAKTLAGDNGNILNHISGCKLDVRAEEAKNINLSLSALGRVISVLAKPGQQFVPFRDSVLTMMMKESLSGNCRTSVVVTVAEDPRQADETVSSLKFARLCSGVRTSVTQHKARDVGEELSAARKLLTQVEEEIRALEQKGAAGGLDVSFPKTTRDAFQANQKKMVQHIENIRVCKQSLTELKAANKQDSEEFTEMQKRKAYEESQVSNLKGILIRSQSTGVWNEPSKPYLMKLASKRELQNKLISLGEMGVTVDQEYVMTIKDLLS